MHRFGFYVAMVEQDIKSGSKLSRNGYISIAAAVQKGLIEAVGVYMMARAAVAWSDADAALIEAGLLVVGAAPEPPAPDPKREKLREAVRRCRARKAATQSRS